MMTKMMPLLMLTISMSLIFTNTPLSLGVNILMMAITITLLISFMSSTWLALVIFIIYIGGLLVLFAYFLIIQPNLILSLLKTYVKTLTLFLILSKLSHNNSTLMSFSENIPSTLTIMSYSNLPLVILMGMMLLLVLIVTVELTTESKATLRPFK